MDVGCHGDRKKKAIALVYVLKGNKNKNKRPKRKTEHLSAYSQNWTFHCMNVVQGESAGHKGMTRYYN